MNAEPRPKIFTEDDAHIDPPQGVGLDQNFACPKHSGHSASPLRVTPANDYASHAGCRIGVAEKDDIDAV
jgi:hypothetical protein